MKLQPSVVVAVLLASTAVHASDRHPEEAVRRLARIGFASSPSFSQNGQTLAFVSGLSGTPQVWTVPASGGWPTQVTALDDTVGSVSWSPTGDWLAISAAPGGGMNQQVYLVSTDGADEGHGFRKTANRIISTVATVDWFVKYLKSP